MIFHGPEFASLRDPGKPRLFQEDGDVMRLAICVFLIVCQVLSVRVSHAAEKETVRLFFLGGQSNMEGHGLNADLPDLLSVAHENIWIFHGNPAEDESPTGGLGLWAKLTPGHGAGFRSDGTTNNLSHRFGPEVAFAQRISQLYPGEKIALIKYARGGSSIDSRAAREYGSWEMDYLGETGINQFDHFLKTVDSALQANDIDGNGVMDELIPCGIIWMQGESDATMTEDIARSYYANLKRLMDLMRATFRNDDLAVVIGKISDSGLENDGKVWIHAELVQSAQEAYVRNHTNAAIVRDTRNYRYSDPYHYDSQAYMDLGKKFAEAVYRLNKP